MPDPIAARLVAIIPTGDRLGEVVLWDGQRSCFWWTDIQQKRLHRLE